MLRQCFATRSAHFLTLLLSLLAGSFIFALPAQADPVGRVGRIAWLSEGGAIYLNNPDSGESFSAPLNQPLTSGDILNSDANTRTEIQIGSMTVRLDADSTLHLDRIDDERVNLYLSDGRAFVKLPAAEIVNDFALDTRNGRFTARDTGIYRFDAQPGSSSATAYYGALHFEGSADSSDVLDIRAGESAQFWRNGFDSGPNRYRLSSVINDDFTQWSAARDRRAATRAYSRYVSPEMTGAEDLDAYGSWSETPEYGALWTPHAVASDWAPYRSGHWAWVAPWGWNWVADEAWGFAPFHYGRWVQHRGRWAWVPGTRIARPVYAPALVAWIGTPGFGLSVSIGNAPAVGWFPLAPREVYVPAYRSSADYIRRVNSSHAHRIDNLPDIVANPREAVRHAHYAHRNQPQAVTVVPVEIVTQRRSAGPSAFKSRDLHHMREQPVQATAPLAEPAHDRMPRYEREARPERQRNEGDARPLHEAATAPRVPLPSPPQTARSWPETRTAQETSSRPFERREREQQMSPTERSVEPRMATIQPSPENERPAARSRMESAAERRPEPSPQRQELRVLPPQREIREARVEQVAPHVQSAPARIEAAQPRLREPRPEGAREFKRPEGGHEARTPAPQAEPHNRPNPGEDELKKRRRRDDDAIRG